MAEIKEAELSLTDGDQNRRVIQKALDGAHNEWKKSGAVMTVKLPAGVYPVVPDSSSGLWTGLNIRSGVVLQGSAKPGEDKLAPAEITAAKATLLQLREPEGIKKEDVIYFVRSDKRGGNTDFGLKDIGLDATSRNYSTNTLFVGKKGNNDKNFTLENVLLTGGSGDYQEAKGARIGAGYALDSLGTDLTITNVVITHSRRGAIFTADAKQRPVMNINGLTINHINDGIGKKKDNHPSINRIDTPAEKKFALMLQNISLGKASSIKVSGFKSATDYPVWIENAVRIEDKGNPIDITIMDTTVPRGKKPVYLKNTDIKVGDGLSFHISPVSDLPVFVSAEADPAFGEAAFKGNSSLPIQRQASSGRGWKKF
jgi:hypothetical protein